MAVMTLGGGLGGGGATQLYSLEVYAYCLSDLLNVRTSANPVVAFRLWDFPTLFVRPDLSNREGHRRGTVAEGGEFRSVCFESGKSCLFQVRLDELQSCLPLTLHVLLVDEHSETNRTVLGSHALVIGDHSDPLKCSVSRGVFPLADVLGSKVGMMTVDVRLTCLGHSSLPPSLQQPHHGAAAAGHPSGGRLLPGAQAPTRADVGGQPVYVRDASGRFVPVQDAAGGAAAAAAAGSASALASLAGPGGLEGLSAAEGGGASSRRRHRSSQRRLRRDEESSLDCESTASAWTEDSLAPAQGSARGGGTGTGGRGKRTREGRRQGGGGGGGRTKAREEGVRKYLRYEVLAQLATLMTLVEDYTNSDRKLGYLSQYSLEERDFFDVEVGLLKNLVHNTNKVLSAVDQHCYNRYGASALGIPLPSRTHTPHRRERSRERVHAPVTPPPPPPLDDDATRSKQRERERSGERTPSPRSRSGRDAQHTRSERDGASHSRGRDGDGDRYSPSSSPSAKREEEERQAREKERARDKEREREREREKESYRDTDRHGDRHHARDSDRVRDSDRLREREREDAERAKEREKEDEKERERERERDRDRERERDRERDRDREHEREREREREREQERERDALVRRQEDERLAAKRQDDERREREEKDREKEREREQASQSSRERERERERERKRQHDREREREPEFSVGDAVQVRDTENEVWRGGTVTAVTAGRPSVQITGQGKSFTWNFCEKEKSPAHTFAVGDRARVRDTEKEPWRQGVVATVTGSRVTVRIDGQKSDYTFNMIAPPDEDSPRTIAEQKAKAMAASASSGAEQDAQFRKGDRVRVRDGANEDWRKGTVRSLRASESGAPTPMVCLDGQLSDFAWTLVEHLKDEKEGFQVGDHVRVRDRMSEAWQKGVVESITSSGAVMVKVENISRAFPWQHIQADPDEDAKGATSSSSSSSSLSMSSASSSFGDRRVGGSETSQIFSIGTRVRVRDATNEAWKFGLVEAIVDKKTKVRLDGQERAFTWAYVERAEDGGGGGSTSSVAGSSVSKLSEDVFNTGDRVRVRDNDRDQWREGTVESVVGKTASVKIDGQFKAFTWNFTEHMGAGDRGASGQTSSSSQLREGDRVRVRDSERESWKMGTVHREGGSRPMVVVDGQTKPFAWGYYEKVPASGASRDEVAAKWAIGDRVRVRDTTSEQWRPGTVSAMTGHEPLVKIDGASRPLKWAMIEREPPADKFKIGDHVLVRDVASDNWKRARVEATDPKMLAKVEGASRAFGWAMVKKDDSTASASSSFNIGDRVRFRDLERDAWKRGVVESIGADSKPVVRGNGQTRSFTWTYVEREDAPSGGATWRVGDKVRVRDSERDTWQMGTVEALAGTQPKVRIGGAAKAFTWRFVERVDTTGPSTFAVGDKVRVRDRPSDEWKSGVVKSAGPKPMVQTSTGTFMWQSVEHEEAGGGGVNSSGGSISSGASRTTASSSGLPPAHSSSAAASTVSAAQSARVGDTIQVRDSEKEPWKRGVVVSASGSKPTVRVEGSERSFTWNYYRADDGDGPIADKYRPGDKVLVRDRNDEDWKEGTVDTAYGSNPTVKLVGQHSAFTWAHIKKFAYSVGDKVRVRDSNVEQWKEGIVDSVIGESIKVRVGSQRAFTWNEIQRF